MISYIEGKIVEKSPTYIIVECNGIGYMINISLHTYSQLNDDGRCCIFTHQVIREDAHMLFGFATKAERKLFRSLISVSGVGANTARMLLSSLSPDEIYNAILSSQVDVLQRVKGIGSKSAQRIIVDLKDRLEKDSAPGEFVAQPHNTNRNEALSALVMLGFTKQACEKVIEKIIREEPAVSVEDIIKKALKTL